MIIVFTEYFMYDILSQYEKLANIRDMDTPTLFLVSGDSKQGGN